MEIFGKNMQFSGHFFRLTGRKYVYRYYKILCRITVLLILLFHNIQI